MLEFAALWGDWLMDVRHLPAQGVVRIGEGGLPGPLEDLLFEDGELLLPHGTEGRVLEDGVWRPFQGGPLHQSGRYWVTSGGFSWLVRWVPPGTRLPAAREVRRETGLLMSLGMSGFLAALLWIVAVTAPPSPQVTLEEIRDQFAKVTLA